MTRKKDGNKLPKALQRVKGRERNGTHLLIYRRKVARSHWPYVLARLACASQDKPREERNKILATVKK